VSNYGFWTYGNKCGLEGAASALVEMADGRIVTQRDSDNPAVLEDTFIAYSLRTSRQARNDFTRLFSSLSKAAQSRLTDLILQNPAQTSLILNDQVFADAIQHKEVTAGVRTRLEMAIRKLPGGL
jgi:hypothetical protein